MIKNLLKGIILDDLVSFINALKPFLASIDPSKIYHVLPVMKAEMLKEDKNFIITPHAIKIHKDMDVIELANTFRMGVNNTMLKYHVSSFIELSLLFREWYTLDKLVTSKSKMLNTINKLHMKQDELQSIMADKSFLRFKETLFGGIFFDSNSLSNLFLINGNKDYNIDMPNYRAEVKFNHRTGDINYWTAVIFDLRGTKIGEFKFEYDSVKFLVTRTYSDFTITFKVNKDNNDIIQSMEVKYKFPYIKRKSKELSQDHKIGTADFECYTDSQGIFKVLSAAFCIIKDGSYVVKSFYINSHNIDVISCFLDSLLTLEYDGYTFYFHNLAKFDGIFLMHKLLHKKLKFTTIMKEDNSIVNFVVKYKKVRITFKDSLLLLSGSLAKLGRGFQVPVTKDVFPYKFATLDNIFYIGPVPDISYFENMTKQQYIKYCERFNGIWNFQEENLKYLKQDVISLLQILIKFNNEIFEDYSVNITSYNTIASLALGILLSNFFPKASLCVIKGQIEDEIRSAYYGGITHVHSHEIKNGFYYDINSSYPASMLNPMPIGNPTFTTEEDLAKIFGFVKAEVTAPTKEVLANAILPFRTDSGLELFRGTRVAMWFSEELKFAKSLGYKINIIHSYTFKKGYDVFNDYILHFYNKKSANDLNPSKRLIAKFLLNTIYGRMGMKQIEYRVKLVPTRTASQIMKSFNWTTILEFGDRSLIRYGPQLDENLLRHFNITISENNSHKIQGVISSIPVAAATSAYSRILLNQFVNIPGNLAIYTDRMVGKALGDMKLVSNLQSTITKYLNHLYITLKLVIRHLNIASSQCINQI
jgi:hypothetical protein